MAVLKRATAKLRAAGIQSIEVHSGLWGPYLYDPTMKRQAGTVYRSADQAVRAALDGERPRASQEGRE